MGNQKRDSARWFSAVTHVVGTTVLVLRYRTVFRAEWWIKFAGGKEVAGRDGVPQHTAFREGREELLSEGAITRVEEFYVNPTNRVHSQHFFLCDFRGILREQPLQESQGAEILSPPFYMEALDLLKPGGPTMFYTHQRALEALARRMVVENEEWVWIARRAGLLDRVRSA